MRRRLQNQEAARQYRLRQKTEETEEETAIRRLRDAERMRRRRNQGTEEETAIRRKQDAERRRRRRIEGTEEETAIRRSRNAEGMRQYRMRMKEKNINQPATSVMEMEHIEIKEEPHENLFLEHQTWDEVQVKLEPEVEITIDDNTVQLPEQMAHFSSTDLMNAFHGAIKVDPDGTQSEVLHSTVSPDSGMQLSLNVKPLSLI